VGAGLPAEAWVKRNPGDGTPPSMGAPRRSPMAQTQAESETNGAGGVLHRLAPSFLVDSVHPLAQESPELRSEGKAPEQSFSNASELDMGRGRRGTVCVLAKGALCMLGPSRDGCGTERRAYVSKGSRYEPPWCWASSHASRQTANGGRQVSQVAGRVAAGCVCAHTNSLRHVFIWGGPYCSYSLISAANWPHWPPYQRRCPSCGKPECKWSC
jgi:hypothetical protein